jgi:IS5 family transposase
MRHFQWQAPCHPTDLVYFRKRTGEAGVEKIFKATAQLHGKNACEREVVIDTTVQEKNITFPTDTKLRAKVMTLCWMLAAKENIQLRRSYRRVLKAKLRIIRFSKSLKDKKKVAQAIRRVKTMANALLRDIMRKLSKSSLTAHRDDLARYQRVVNQERYDKNKIYSLHEPGVCCISKGKERKKYEFGAKAAIVMTKTTGIIVGAMNYPHNDYDGDTLKTVLPQVERISGKVPETALCDRGFRGRKQVGKTRVVLPGSPAPGASEHAKRKARKDFGRRSAIEPVIGHMKNDFRLARNYLKGTIGDELNLLLAAAAFNCKKWLNARAQGLLFALSTFLFLDGPNREKPCNSLS